MGSAHRKEKHHDFVPLSHCLTIRLGDLKTATQSWSPQHSLCRNEANAILISVVLRAAVTRVEQLRTAP